LPLLLFFAYLLGFEFVSLMAISLADFGRPKFLGLWFVTGKTFPATKIQESHRLSNIHTMLDILANFLSLL
jgi:hypothetical protein